MATPKSGLSKPHEPTEKTRAEVSALTSFGNSQEDIAMHLGINVNTLVKYYRDELDTSVVRANAKVASKLFRKATDGDDLSAMIFWLKTRARWRTEDSRILESAVDNDALKAELAELRAKLSEKAKSEY